MLDLQFVRANLELVETKLRARGADPAALLGDFRALDKNRREAITLAEQCKARRNEPWALFNRFAASPAVNPRDSVSSPAPSAVNSNA